MSNKQPLWKQTFDKLRDKIENEYNIGELLPGEHELVELYDVSRITIRRALDELNSAGLIKRERGKGTVIISKNEKLQTIVTSTSTSLKEHEVKSRYLEILGYEYVTDLEILNFFQIENSTNILKVVRSSVKESKKIATYITYLNPRVKLSATDNFSDSLYQLLESCGNKITRFSETITTHISTEEDEMIFDVSKKISIMKRQRCGYSHDLPVEYTIAIYNGDIYSMVVNSELI